MSESYQFGYDCPACGKHCTTEGERLEVQQLTPRPPLFGHRTTRQTHWVGFMKEAA